MLTKIHNKLGVFSLTKIPVFKIGYLMIEKFTISIPPQSTIHGTLFKEEMVGYFGLREGLHGGRRSLQQHVDAWWSQSHSRRERTCAQFTSCHGEVSGFRWDGPGRIPVQKSRHTVLTVSYRHKTKF